MEEDLLEQIRSEMFKVIEKYFEDNDSLKPTMDTGNITFEIKTRKGRVYDMDGFISCVVAYDGALEICRSDEVFTTNRKSAPVQVCRNLACTLYKNKLLGGLSFSERGVL